MRVLVPLPPAPPDGPAVRREVHRVLTPGVDGVALTLTLDRDGPPPAAVTSLLREVVTCLPSAAVLLVDVRVTDPPRGALTGFCRALVAGLAEPAAATVLVVSDRPHVVDSCGRVPVARGAVVPDWCEPATAVLRASAAGEQLVCLPVRRVLAEPSVVERAHTLGLAVGCVERVRPVDGRLLAVAGVDLVVSDTPHLLSAAGAARPLGPVGVTP